MPPINATMLSCSSSRLTDTSNDYTLPLLDYPLYCVTCTYDYVMYTGNISFAQTYYPKNYVV